MKRGVMLLFACTAALALGACATGAKSQNMVHAPSDAQQPAYDEALRGNTFVEAVQGGKETNPAWTSEISNEAFEAALKESLANVGLLERGGRYRISVMLQKVEQPLLAFNTKVTTHVRYTLTDSKTNSTLLDRLLVTSYTAAVSESFFGVKRLRLANEGAGMESIKAFLSELEELDLPEGGLDVLGQR